MTTDMTAGNLALLSGSAAQGQHAIYIRHFQGPAVGGYHEQLRKN